MGGEPEKLLTLQEAARRLGLPADDVGVMIREGRLPSFRLAGNLLRLKLRDVERLRLERQRRRPRLTEAAPSSLPRPNAPVFGIPRRPRWSSLQKCRGVGAPRRSKLLERISDFFYFNDFYLLAFLILLTLLAIILTL